VDDDKHCRIMESEYPGVTLAFLPDRTFPYRVTRLHDGKTVYTMAANLCYICAGLTGQTDWTASHDGPRILAITRGKISYPLFDGVIRRFEPQQRIVPNRRRCAPAILCHPRVPVYV